MDLSWDLKKSVLGSYWCLHSQPFATCKLFSDWRMTWVTYKLSCRRRTVIGMLSAEAMIRLYQGFSRLEGCSLETALSLYYRPPEETETVLNSWLLSKRAWIIGEVSASCSWALQNLKSITHHPGHFSLLIAVEEEELEENASGS